MNPESFPPPSPPVAASRAGRGLAWLALWLAVLAVAGTVWLGWQQRQLHNRDAVQNDGLQHRVDAAAHQLEVLSRSSAEAEQQVLALSQRDQSAIDQIQGMDLRLRTLDSAVARLSEKTLSVHDSLVMDQIESLLLTARQRAELFHDLAGALSAYQLAGEALSQLGNPQLEGVRSLLMQEQADLIKSQPQARHDAEASLAALRLAIPALALKPAQADPVVGHGFWARIWAALGHVLSVRRETAAGVPGDMAGLARELAELDAVEAQTALLADDSAAYVQALQRLGGILDNQFDPAQGEVAHARASIALLLKQRSDWTSPRLGAALEALRDVRRVQSTAQPPATAASAAAPAPASSGAQP